MTTAPATGELTPSSDPQRTSVRRVIAYVLLIAWSLLMFVPFAWTLVTSLKDRPEALRVSLPASPDFEAWAYTWQSIDPGLPQMMASSLLLAGVVTASNLFLGSMAGYAFARLTFPGRDVLFVVVLATLMIPDQLRIVPVYQIMNFLGLINKNPTNYLSVILVLAVSATSIFLLRQYFLTIPRDLEEAARIDGAGYFQTYWQVILPLAAPALAAVGVLTFQGTWNGLFWPLVLMNQAKEHWTLPVGITQLQGAFHTNWPPLMALVVITTIPILALYIYFQRYFVEGIAAAGVKG
ncbi:MAG TPA: carbohydrate ABC transporter permease [Candidatus Limnocylindrales bacterium]|nr:carbohydrate ABC transporter permease [Candidatus Limnocylindrales bacterium]